MYVNPFWFGVATTVFAELCVFTIYACVSIIKTKIR